MKKYLILAAAAIVAMAACSKTQLDESSIPDMPVTFQATNYVTQTKAGEVSVLNDFTAFKCKAYLHAEGIDLDANGNVNGTSFQNFFGTDGETISWNSTAKEWAPSHTYYWPKGAKSFVNFIGWYGVDGTGADSAPTIIYAYDGNKITLLDLGSEAVLIDGRFRLQQMIDECTISEICGERNPDCTKTFSSSFPALMTSSTG